MEVDSPETNLSGDLASLSQAYLDAAGDRCSAGAAGRFALRDGPSVPAAPEGGLASPLILALGALEARASR